MSHHPQDQQTADSNGRESITIEIDGVEDLTVIDNPPGFPTPEELKMYVGAGNCASSVEFEEAEDAVR